MSRFNELYRGEPGDAADQLEDREATDQELKAALVNALRRIERLEAQERTSAIQIAVVEEVTLDFEFSTMGRMSVRLRKD